jgi:cytosine permease
MNKEAYLNKSIKTKPVNIGAIIAVVAGALAGIFLKVGIPPVNSLLVSAVVYFIYEVANKNKGMEA